MSVLKRTKIACRVVMVAVAFVALTRVAFRTAPVIADYLSSKRVAEQKHHHGKALVQNHHDKVVSVKSKTTTFTPTTTVSTVSPHTDSQATTSKNHADSSQADSGDKPNKKKSIRPKNQKGLPDDPLTLSVNHKKSLANRNSLSANILTASQNSLHSNRFASSSNHNSLLGNLPISLANENSLYNKRFGSSANQNSLAHKRRFYSNQLGPSGNRSSLAENRLGSSANQNSLSAYRLGSSANQNILSGNRLNSLTNKNSLYNNRFGSSANQITLSGNSLNSSAYKKRLYGNQLSYSGNRSHLSANRLGSSANQNSLLANRFGFSANQNSLSGNRLRSSANKNSLSSNRLSFAVNQLANQNGLLTNQLSSSANKNSLQNIRLGSSVNQNKLSSNQKTLPTNQIRSSSNQKTLSTNQKSTSLIQKIRETNERGQPGKDQTRQTRKETKSVESDEEIVEIFKHRRDVYTSVCRQLLAKGKKKHFNGRIFLYEPAHLSVCSVPKVGATFWKRIFFFLFNTTRRVGEGEERQRVSSPMAYDRYFVHTNSIHRVSVDVHQPGALQQLFNTTRVLFARDPWSRLWSGYVDKLVLPDSWLDYGNGVLRRRRELGLRARELYQQSAFEQQVHGQGNWPLLLDNSTVDTKMKCSDDVTFAEFLHFATTSLSSHWKPVTRKCEPCVYRPHYVGKLETFARDTSFILNKVGLGHLLGPMSHSSHVLDELWLLTDYHMKHLYHHPTLPACIDSLGVARRLWRAFQLNGYIPVTTVFPAPVLAKELRNATVWQARDRLMAHVMKAHSAKPLSHAEWSALKRQILIGAYRSVPKSVIEGIREKFDLDFRLFEYDREPTDIFGG